MRGSPEVMNTTLSAPKSRRRGFRSETLAPLAGPSMKRRFPEGIPRDPMGVDSPLT